MKNSIELHSGESTLYIIHPVTHACMIIILAGSLLKILALRLFGHGTFGQGLCIHTCI